MTHPVEGRAAGQHELAEAGLHGHPIGLRRARKAQHVPVELGRRIEICCADSYFVNIYGSPFGGIRSETALIPQR
ncbi:hypothetical protein [Nocardia suismassiliense]|uniref:hypothetical protein n=1 Tax=Nocardia suismassiliense TaxID=2077092 RepID=UPI000D1DE12A|nr:hypothetical protein [Nocardia suismassiliense]